MQPELDLVRRRREEMAVEENNLRAQLDRLVAEREELQRIEAYLATLVKRFDVETKPDKEIKNRDGDSVESERETSQDATRHKMAPTPRPDGLPTLADMIDAVLADAERQGRDGLASIDMVKAINDRFWPGVVANSVMPTAHKFVRLGRLVRKDNLFARVPQHRE